MSRLIALALAAALTGCTNLSQCAQFAPDSQDHAACVQKAYQDAANASTMPAVLDVILRR